MAGLSGVEVKASICKGNIWNVPGICGAGHGITIMATNIRREVTIDVDDSLGIYFSREGIPEKIKVEFDIPFQARYNTLDLLFALFMGIAGTPVQQGGTAAYAYVYKWKADTDGLFGTFVKNMKYYVEEYASVKAATLNIKGEIGQSLQAAIGMIASNKKTNSTLTPPVVATISVGTDPIGVIYARSVDRVYVANQNSDNVSVINPNTNTVVATISVGVSPRSVGYASSADRVYAANFTSGNVSVINPNTNAVVTAIDVGTGPTGITYARSVDRVYVVNQTSNNVSVINPNTNTVVTTISVGSSPRSVGYVSSVDRVYTANFSSNNVSVINPNTNAVVTTIDVGTGPRDVAYASSVDRVYVANQTSNNVSVINPNTNTVVATISVGSSPRSIEYASSVDRVYTANFSSNNVSVINPNTNAVVTAIDVGTGPHGIRYVSSVDRVCAANFTSDNVSIIVPESNTPATFASVTWADQLNRIRYSEGVFRMNNQSAGALNDADKIYPSSFELVARRRLAGEYDGRHKTYQPNVQDLIDEPSNDGIAEITMKLTFPRHTSMNYLADLISNTRKKMDITFTGAVIEGVYRNQFKLQFPNLQLKNVDVVDAQGNIKEPLEFVVHGAISAPSGMTGLTDPFWISGINTRSTNPLA